MRELLITDIETIPDPELLPEPPEDMNAIKPIQWKIVCVSYIRAIMYEPSLAITVDRIATAEGADERAILQGFWSWIGKRKPRVITWNGRGFDLMILKHRAMVHRVSAPAWFDVSNKWENYEQRYAKNLHLDLMDAMSGYGAAKNMGLDQVAKALGYPGKSGEGSAVADMIATGRLRDCQDYCELDCVNLFGVFLRWCHLIGDLTDDALAKSEEGLSQALQKDGRPHLARWHAQWMGTDNQAKESSS